MILELSLCRSFCSVSCYSCILQKLVLWWNTFLRIYLDYLYCILCEVVLDFVLNPLVVVHVQILVYDLACFPGLVVLVEESEPEEVVSCVGGHFVQKVVELLQLLLLLRVRLHERREHRVVVTHHPQLHVRNFTELGWLTL